jgi:hypothetical protein
VTTTHRPVAQHLQTPITENWDWQMTAACRGVDSDAFFHPPTNAPADDGTVSGPPKPSATAAQSSSNASPTPWKAGNRTASGAVSPKRNAPNDSVCNP